MSGLDRRHLRLAWTQRGIARWIHHRILTADMLPTNHAQPVRQHRPSLLSMQHNFESQDGDDEMSTAQLDKPPSAIPPIRRVHSYSGESSNPGDEERSLFGVRSGEDPMAARRTLSALEPTFNLPSGPLAAPRSLSMNTIPAIASTARSSGLVGPSIPLALRRASSDHHAGHEDMQEPTPVGVPEKAEFGGPSAQNVFTAGWTSSSSLQMSATGSPTTPPRASVFNPGSPSQAHAGVGSQLSSAVNRSIGARARANSGTRMRGPGGTFGTPSTSLPSVETRKRSGSGSGNGNGNGNGNGAWQARSNVSPDVALDHDNSLTNRRLRIVSFLFRRNFAQHWPQTKICPARKSARKRSFSASYSPIQILYR
jgi:hypothetical protein